jgi:Ca-activated chloride channel homolog
VVLRGAPAAGPGRRGRTRRASIGALITIAVAVSATLMIGLTARAVVDRVSCSGEPLYLNVAVSFDIAPAIERIANAYNNQTHVAGGRCFDVQITPGEPETVAAQIDGQHVVQGMAPIDAWIPDSSLWVDLARTYPVGAAVVQPLDAISVARSPLLIVTTKAVAAATQAFDVPASWSLLLPPAAGGPPASTGLAVDLPDPVDSATGLAALVEVNRVVGYGVAARAALTRFVYSAESTEDFNSASALESFAASTGPPFSRRAVTVASEQAVLAYDRANPGRQLVAQYPTAPKSTLGSPELDYPYVLTNSAARIIQAATEFGKALRGPYAASVLRYYGFRAPGDVPDVLPASTGLSSQLLQLAAPPSASEAATNLLSWEQLGLGTKELFLIDVSAAMNRPDGNGTQTLEQELTATASIGAGLLPDNTLGGLWEIANDRAGRPYDELVPIGPISAQFGLISRRQQLTQITSTLRAGSSGVSLHDAILDAYQSMTRSYTSSYVNVVIVLTAGVDARHDMALSTMLTKLRSLYNPSRKIEIVNLMFGSQGDFTALQEIAAATDGVAYQISKPADVGTIFIKAMTHRICDQGCPAP